MSRGAPLAYYWGQDGFGIERAVDRLAGEIGAPGERLRIWRVDGDGAEASDAPSGRAGSGGRQTARLVDAVEERIATAPLFGGGTLVVVRQPAPLLRDTAGRARVLALLGGVPTGNGLAFTELVDGRSTGTTEQLRQEVASRGGEVREFPALTRERMERWAVERAAELGIRLGPGATRLLAERVGAYVREGDVDRRAQSLAANAELEKLALYRPGGTLSRDDVAELVAETVPGSTWAFLDAVGERRPRQAAELLERLERDAVPLPVLASQLHRRLRELLQVRDHLANGKRPNELVRLMRLQPYRAQRLAEAAARWSPEELEHALEGLLEHDLASKGIALDGSTVSQSDDRAALALHVWLAEHLVGGRRR